MSGRSSSAFGAVGATLFTVAALIGGYYAITAIGVAIQPARIVQKTFDADNVVYNYEWFKRQNQDIVAVGMKIANADATLQDFEASAGPRIQWTFEDKQRDGELSSIALGLRNQQASMIAEYNARAQMANRDIFRTPDLPDHID